MYSICYEYLYVYTFTGSGVNRSSSDGLVGGDFAVAAAFFVEQRVEDVRKLISVSLNCSTSTSTSSSANRSTDEMGPIYD